MHRRLVYRQIYINPIDLAYVSWETSSLIAEQYDLSNLFQIGQSW